jgi:hypothetical protein
VPIADFVIITITEFQRALLAGMGFMAVSGDFRWKALAGR